MFRAKKSTSGIPKLDADALAKRINETEGKALWDVIDANSPQGKAFETEADKHGGVVHLPGGVSAVKPALPKSFTKFRKLGDKNGQYHSRPELVEDVKGYLLKVEQEGVEAYMEECLQLNDVIEDLNKLSPIEWSAKYALPLLLTASVQHFAVIELLEDDAFRADMLESWKRHVATLTEAEREVMRKNSLRRQK